MNAAPPLKRVFITWEMLHRDAKALAAELRKLGPWKGIVAVTRGGLVPASIIARELDIHIFETVVIEGYKHGEGDHAGQDEPKILKYPANVGDGEGWLLIDDLAATGRTAEILRRLMPKAHFAAVYAKPAGRPMLDSVLAEVGQDTWIYLPWYNELQFKHPIAATVSEYPKG